MGDYSNWYMFKVEDSETEKPCLSCSKPTKQKITAMHVMFKKMEMGACCSEDCFKVYKDKYGV